LQRGFWYNPRNFSFERSEVKACPKCQRTYAEEIECCPRDGTRLETPATQTEELLASGLVRRFRIVRPLGKGGMGTVFLAEQIGVGDRPVALKVLNRKLLDDPEFLLRFRNEAGSTGRIHHSNVVTIYESGQGDDGTPYIAMEFLEGESLREVLKRRGALPLAECAEILHQTARGLNAAHKLSIIHRDLKPDNIFLTRSAEGELVIKVVDFGIAKLLESGTHTLTGTVLGTPAYMSCEQASGMKSDELDVRSDIYSLGVVVYEMLTGRVPFHSDTPLGYLRKHMLEPPPPFRAVKPDLPVLPEIESVVMKALAKNREQRFDSALEFAREFSRAVSAWAKAEAEHHEKIGVPAETVGVTLNNDLGCTSEDDAKAHDKLGRALAEKGDLDGAIAEYREALRLIPNLAEVHDRLGRALWRKRDLEGAATELRTAIRLRPDFPGSYVFLYLVLRGLGDLDGAIAAMREAIRLSPGSFLMHAWLGDTLRRKGDLEEAILEYRTSIQLEPADAGFHLALAVAFETKGDRLAARDEMEKAHVLSPTAWSIADSIAEAYARIARPPVGREEYDNAIAAYHEALRLDPDCWDIWFNLALRYRGRDDLDKAIATNQEVIRLNPNYAMGWYWLGEAYSQQGNKAKVLEVFEHLKSINPEDADDFYREYVLAK
jgi:tetratricopeptide (TPR) repeat protein